MSLPAHPLARRIPALSEADYGALRDDIEEHGQRIPIVLYEEQILDGVHRGRACDELGLEPVTETFVGSDLEALALVVSLNLRRRHLSKDVLATLGVETLLADQRAAAKARQAEAGGEQPGPLRPESAEAQGKAVEQVAKAVGVGKTKVREAERVRDEDPELFEQVAIGEKPLRDAVVLLDERKAEADPAYAAAKQRKAEAKAVVSLMRAAHTFGHRADLEVALAAIPSCGQQRQEEYRARLDRAETTIARVRAALDGSRLRRVQ